MYTKDQQLNDLLRLLQANGLAHRFLIGHIQEDLYQVYGLTPVGEIPETNLWAIVGRHPIGGETSWRS